MSTRPAIGRLLAVTLATTCVGLVAMVGPMPVEARTARIDPATLPRGADPTVPHMIEGTIVDGARTAPATARGDHVALWTTSRGYVVKDAVSPPGGATVTRLVFVSRTGRKRTIARFREYSSLTTAQAVSPSGRRIAWAVQPDEARLRTRIKVANPDTGRVLAVRAFRLTTVVAVTGNRVLLAHRVRWRNPETTWWDYRRDTLVKVADQAAVGADLRHDKVVFDRSTNGEFCNRVARLSQPSRTLWRSCRIYPHQWSPDGSRALATHTYFDAAGTDRWLTIDGRIGRPLGRVSGRLDWDAAWEDNRHFLTMAQGDSGTAAIVRCTVAGRCERASRLWPVPLPDDPSVYYAPPPVVLATD
jgi:hypothetical protein